MIDSDGWRPLPLESSSQTPTLLSSIQTGDAHYAVRITDLANLWVETLDAKAIKIRGWAEGTALDPSDSTENMTKLLSCLRAALESSHKDHHQTSMSLSQASPSDAGEGGLTVHITCSLPGLPPLVWPLHLRRASSSSIASALVLPLVHNQYSRGQEIESLATMLAQKDAVLTKLIDKLEANGTGLEHVFNQFSGKKKITRSVAEGTVKGLAPFDRQQWQHSLKQQERPSDEDQLVREVFRRDNVHRRGSSSIEESPKLDRWWLDLKGTLQISSSEKAPEARQPTSRRSPMIHDTPVEDGNDDDDFQMQETPPHLVSRAKQEDKRFTEMADDDSSTDSEGNELTTSQLAPRGARASSSAAAEAPKTRARFGVIGGRKPSPPKRSVSPEPVTSTTSNAKADDSDTASDVDDNDDNETASTADPSPPPSPPKSSAPAKRRMGRIGGRATTPTAKSSSEEAKHEEAPSHPPRIGTIGKGQASKVTDKSKHSDPEARGRQTAREISKGKDEPRETSTERADRRRAELKKDLEKKAAAGPAKKKRKF